MLDPSHDLYGAGGLVSTAADLNRFHRALFGGRVISRRSLRRHDEPSRQSGRDRYGMGLTARHDCGGRVSRPGGFWGSLTIYCPRRKLAISVTVNAASPGDPEAVVQRLAKIAG